MDPRIGAVVAYTWSLAPERLEAVLAAGARGVLSKSTPAEELLDALAAIDRGEIVVEPHDTSSAWAQLARPRVRTY